MASSSPVAVGGSRSLPASFAPLVVSVCRALSAAGRPVFVSDCWGGLASPARSPLRSFPSLRSRRRFPSVLVSSFVPVPLSPLPVRSFCSSVRVSLRSFPWFSGRGPFRSCRGACPLSCFLAGSCRPPCPPSALASGFPPVAGCGPGLSGGRPLRSSLFLVALFRPFLSFVLLNLIHKGLSGLLRRICPMAELKLYEPGKSECVQCGELFDPSVDSLDSDTCTACEWANAQGTRRYIIVMAQAQAAERRGA